GCASDLPALLRAAARDVPAGGVLVGTVVIGTVVIGTVAVGVVVGAVVVVGAEVGLDHLGIGAHGIRGAGGDLPAVVEYQDVVGQAHHHGHPVLHEAHGDPAVDDPADQPGEPFGFLLGQPCRRFVEQEQLGLGGQCQCDRHPF